ncbi:MAG: TadE/TadG family type IV pilus assembly protein [Burkholderiaceae bacterium]
MAHWRRGRGQALIEWLVVMPLLLLFCLGVLQVALVIQARFAIAHGAHEAIRVAVSDHGRDAAIAQGLAWGLRPFWREPDLASALARLAHAQADGGVRWRRIAPDPAVFDDFGEQGVDDHGQSIPGRLELPNDNLAFRPLAVGARSGLDLLQANRLGLEFVVAVPLDVPFAGPLFGRLAAI